MRALHYISAYFPKPLGAAYAARQLVHQLKARAIEVQWVVDTQASGAWEDGGTFEGIPIRSFTLSQSGKWRKLHGLIRLARFLKPQRKSFDVVHIHGGDFVTITVGFLMGRFLRAKVLLKITSDGFDTPEGVLQGRYGWLVSRCYRRLDAVVSMTTGQAAKTKAWGYSGLLKVIPNGVDTNRFTPLSEKERCRIRADLNIPATVPVVIYSGWLGKGKGTDVLFQIWHAVLKRHPDTYLLLIGNFLTDYEHDRALKECLAEAGFGEAIFEHPQIRNLGVTETPEKFLAMSDVFVFPSKKEGFGTVQIEAMACGLPCVVADLPGVSEDIFPDESTGFRIPQGDWAEGAKKVCQLIENPDSAKEIGYRARQRAEEVFSLRGVADQYQALYQELCS